MTKITTASPPWQELADALTGDLVTDALHRILFATDASVYRSMPLAVVFPKDEADVIAVVRFAAQYQLAITPRAGGTSLAGQAVGEGIIVDVSRYMTQLLAINIEEGYVVVQPGLIRDQLNAALAPLGYWFGPNTSTANRCTLGGMLGNNSCGTTSITVGSTRDHTLAVRCVLSNGQPASFGPLTAAEITQRAFTAPDTHFLFPASTDNDNDDQDSAATSLPALDTGYRSARRGKAKPQSAKVELATNDRLEAIYDHLLPLLSDANTRAAIATAYPRADISRRNTGYALDLLAQQSPFQAQGAPLNLATLLAGSEGTLAFTTAIKLRILPLPPAGRAVVALHFPTVLDSMRAVVPVMAQQPFLCELMDDVILDAAQQNPTQKTNSAFIEGQPGGLLLVEFRAANNETAAQRATQIAETLLAQSNCYAAPILLGNATENVWQLRAAGLGVLSNIPGEKKAVACIEDTAVAIEDLAAYIEEFTALLQGFGQKAVYYAHAGAGEIHLRPILDLKTHEDRRLFYEITQAVALLVKKYRGSLSGEHGDGRVRAAFIPLMLGQEVYQLLRELKQLWDPQGLFNPGKIIDAPPMNEDLRYEAEQKTPIVDTILDFRAEGGLLALAEKCNGSGDCRKISGGTMCPSYRATRNEKDTTRGRANALREILSRETESPFSHPVLAQALDLCLSCKACTTECPSNVDMSALKAEYLHQRHQVLGIPWRYRLFAHIDQIYQWAAYWPGLFNFGLRWAGPIKKWLGVAPQRSLPMASGSLRAWFKRQSATDSHPPTGSPTGSLTNRKLYFFGDEFTNYQDAAIGKAAIQLLQGLGYEVLWPSHSSSGRAAISKGLLKKARDCAQQNVAAFAPLVSAQQPLVGLEPSAILSFRDEYPKLLRGAEQKQAQQLAQHSYTITEFLYREAQAGHIRSDQFTDLGADIRLHSHCYEKALGRPEETAFLLALPPQFTVQTIPSGCCGMAGSFGYEAEHYGISMAIGEEILFPAIRQAKEQIIVASGTSCRHQIQDGTGRKALHPVEILLKALHFSH